LLFTAGGQSATEFGNYTHYITAHNASLKPAMYMAYASLSADMNGTVSTLARLQQQLDSYGPNEYVAIQLGLCCFDTNLTVAGDLDQSIQVSSDCDCTNHSSQHFT
jgi:hypothetical protein